MESVGDGASYSTFHAFAEATYDRLFRAAVLLVGEQDAGDLTHEALMKSLRAWPRMTFVKNKAGYTYRIMLNVFLSEKRRRRLELIPGDVQDLEDSGADLSISLISSDGRDIQSGHADHEVLRMALLELPPRQRAVVVYRFYLDFSHGEIATLMQVQESYVRSAQTKALASLRSSPAMSHWRK